MIGRRWSLCKAWRTLVMFLLLTSTEQVGLPKPCWLNSLHD